MGGLWSILGSLKNTFFGHEQIRIIMCGLQGAGKTTIIYRLKLGEVVTTTPTIGFNVETVQHKKVSLMSWDVGGKIHPSLYEKYYQNTDALVFVVDSNDRARIQEAHDELWRLLEEDELHDSVILIFANKKDLPNAMNVTELTDKLELNKITDRKWHIEPTFGGSGDGLYEGLDWLNDQLTGAAANQSAQTPSTNKDH